MTDRGVWGQTWMDWFCHGEVTSLLHQYAQPWGGRSAAGERVQQEKKPLSADSQAGVWHCCVCFKALSTSTFPPQCSRCAFFHCIAKSVHHLLGFIICWQPVLRLVSFFAAERTAKGRTFWYSQMALRSRLDTWDSIWKPRVFFSTLSYFFSFSPSLVAQGAALNHQLRETHRKWQHEKAHTHSHTHSIQPLQK